MKKKLQWLELCADGSQKIIRICAVLYHPASPYNGLIAITLS